MDTLVKILLFLLTSYIVISSIRKITASFSTKGNQDSLCYGNVMQAVVFISYVFFIGLIYALLRHGEYKETYELAMVVAFIIFLACGWSEVAFTKGFFDKTGIDFQSLWKGRRYHEWSQLINIEYDKVMEEYELDFGDGKKILISRYLKGHRELMTQLRGMGHIF